MSYQSNHVRVFGLVPAAGLSLRMGTAKQTLPYQNSTVTGFIIQTLLETKLEAVIVITRRELANEIGLPNNSRIHVAFNDEPGSQMMDSIMLGLRKIDEIYNVPSNAVPAIGILVMPGDMPTVSSDVCCQCVDVFMRHPTKIIMATHQGKRGHPIVFPLSLCSELEAISKGLNELPRLYPNMVYEVDAKTPSILHDVDTPADYDRLTS